MEINQELVSRTLRSLCRCEEFTQNNYPQIIIETEYLILNNNIKSMSISEINLLLKSYKDYNKRFKVLQTQDNSLLNECIDLILNKINGKI